MSFTKLKPFPTGVGMNRFNHGFFTQRTTVPHRRGDEPESEPCDDQSCNRSPQAWG